MLLPALQRRNRMNARLAARIRKDTTMSLKWIAHHLEMGTWTHLSNLLGAKRKQKRLKSEN
jgi:hypothetical protein